MEFAEIKLIGPEAGIFIFRVVHNLKTFGSDLSAAVENYSARLNNADEISVWRFCEYVTSKDPVNILCIPAEQYHLIP